MTLVTIARDRLTQARVLVVGDAMLDRYWFGAVERISPEAPVPVVRVEREEERLGGAANVALNATSLGARASLLTVLGDDEPGRKLTALIEQAGVASLVGVDPALYTIVKLRVIGRSQQLIRVDFENQPRHEALLERLDEYQRVLPAHDAVLFSDYGKGGLTHIPRMIELARAAGRPVLIDPKGNDYSRYAGATVITPNRAELAQVVGQWTSEADLHERAHALRRKHDIGALVLTRSEEGMSLFDDAGHVQVPAQAREVFDVTGGPKYRNLLGASIADYFDRIDFYGRFAQGEFGKVDAVFHEGACSDTMEHNGRYMLDTNYRCSKDLLDACQARGTRLLYASSAATYGGSESFREEPTFERPLNVYGYSKLLFDNVVRRMLPAAQSGNSAQVAGFRYFNVYGPREQHKGRMASVAFHHFNQFRETGKVKLFGAYGGYAAGEQSRDFVFVDDVVAVNLWFLEHPEASGIFNLGSGRAQPFNDVALATVNACRALQGEAALPLAGLVAKGLVEYIDFPAALVGKYQCFTQADLTRLRDAGCAHTFADVAIGVQRYVEWLSQD